MDVILIGAAIGFAVSLTPKCLPSQGDTHARGLRSPSPMSVVLGLSLSLFALSLMEAMPSSWLFVLSNGITDRTDDGSSRDNHGYLTVSFAYCLVLNALCVYTLIIAPCVAGVLVTERLLNRQDFNIFCCFSSERPWWLECIFGLSGAIYRVMVLLLTILYVILKKCYSLIPTKQKAGVGMARKDSNYGKNSLSLPMTNRDDEGNARRLSAAIVTDCIDRFQELILYRSWSMVFGCLLGVSATLGILQWAAPFVIEPKSSGNTLAVALSWVCAIGIILSALLNGFGSVSMPHSCLAGFYLDPIRPETISKANADFQKTKDSLQDRREQLKEITLKPSTSSPANSTTSPQNTTKSKAGRWLQGGWTIRKQVVRSFSDMGEDIAYRKRVVMEEIRFLETLVEEMREDIEEMKYAQAVEANSRTKMGRIRSWLGMLLSVILLIRLYVACTSIWHHWHVNLEQASSNTRDTTGATGSASAQPKRDPVTTCLLWMLRHHMVSEKEYNNLSQFISLLLTAYLSLSQLRFFLRTLAGIHRRVNHLFCGSRLYNNNSPSSTPRSTDAVFFDESGPFQTRTGVYNHLLAALMGSYFMSCFLVTKMMLPWQYRSAFSGALGGFDAYVIQSDVVNAMFSFSAVVSASVLAMLFGIQRQTALLHTASWKENQLLSRPLSRHPDV